MDIQKYDLYAGGIVLTLLVIILLISFLLGIFGTVSAIFSFDSKKNLGFTSFIDKSREKLTF